MSTRSLIAKLNNDNYIYAIYCHFDGYIDGVGETLLNYYNNSESIDKLFELGDLSELNESLETTKAYHRDYKEALVKPKCFKNTENLIEYFHNSDTDYLYLYIDNKWYVYTRASGKFESVEDKLNVIVAKI